MHNNAVDQQYMKYALELAEMAQEKNEVPVGAIVVFQNEIIGKGWNQSLSSADPTAHAEIIALRDAAIKLNNYRLVDTTLYVTLEPCVMCIGALIHARIKRLVFGASDQKTGAVHSVFNLLEGNKFNHKINSQWGVLGSACGDLLKNFFLKKR